MGEQRIGWRSGGDKQAVRGGMGVDEAAEIGGEL